VTNAVLIPMTECLWYQMPKSSNVAMWVGSRSIDSF
jgi:hypothetical protein